MGHTSYEGGFHTPHDRLRPPAQHRLAFPGEVVSEQADGVYAILPCQEAQGRQAPERPGTEQVSPMVTETLLPQEPAGRCPSQDPPREQPGTRAHQPTSCRATSACAKVTPSTYSRSPPMGSPRANRVTRTSIPASSC